MLLFAVGRGILMFSEAVMAVTEQLPSQAVIGTLMRH
jgi:hypothetical protein